MSITALDFSEVQDALPIQSVQWRAARRDQWSGLGSGGAQTYDMGGQLWAATVTIDKSTQLEAREIEARLFALEGPSNRFLFSNPIAAYPKSDPTGSGLVGKTVLIDTIDGDGRRIKLSGLSNGYTLTWGDMWSVDFGSPTLRALFMVTGTATADGIGKTGLFKSTPALWPGMTTTMQVNLSRPSAVCFIVPGSLQMGTIRHGQVTPATFEIMQVLG